MNMAHVHTPLPSKHGELQLAKQLAGFPDDRLHLWFSLNFIPNVRDVDLVIWHERAGIFVVEVKAVPLRAIETFGWQKCTIMGREEDRGPQQQAHEAMHSLRNFVKPLTGRIFLTSVPCFPQIRRSEWNRRWNDQRVIGLYAESLLFQDDLYSDPDALVQRLEFIRVNPIVGEEKQRFFRHDERQFIRFAGALNVNAKPKLSVSDLERLTTIEASVRNEEKKLVPPFSGFHFLYTGAPGTGKTFRLLKVAHHHALHGCKVLFACFNKVLAADIKRLLKFSEKLPLTHGVLEVHDVWEMINLYINKSAQGDLEFDEWACLVVEQMKVEEESLPKFDTILIDEAQDLKGWAFEMLSLHAHERSTICVAHGTGQELYGTAADFLKKFSETARKRSLRRNFRNTEAMARYALTCYQANWDTARIDTVLKRFSSKDKQELFDFARPGGELPNLIGIDESSLNDVSKESYPEAQNELMVAEYRRIIRGELDSLGSNHRPTDLLILVPTQKSNQQRWATEALTAENIEYLDYTQNENRRCIAPADQVRLCTFHSARGIEGQRVIIFGIEQILSVAHQVNAEPRNLGYIVLSRSVLDMTIAYRPQVRTPVMSFLHAVIAAMRSKAGVAVVTVGR